MRLCEMLRGRKRALCARGRAALWLEWPGSVWVTPDRVLTPGPQSASLSVTSSWQWWLPKPHRGQRVELPVASGGGIAPSTSQATAGADGTGPACPRSRLHCEARAGAEWLPEPVASQGA